MEMERTQNSQSSIKKGKVGRFTLPDFKTYSEVVVIKIVLGTSLAFQWLRLCASNARSLGLIPGWGTKIPHAVQCSQKIKTKKIFFKDSTVLALGQTYRSIVKIREPETDPYIYDQVIFDTGAKIIQGDYKVFSMNDAGTTRCPY